MGKAEPIRLGFPLGGLNRRASYRQQPPYASMDCMNVRPFDSIERRERGGSRPGLLKSHDDIMGSGSPVRMLAKMNLVLDDGYASWIDEFDEPELGSVWSLASWAEAEPGLLASLSSAVSDDVEEAAVVRGVLPIDVGEAYAVEMFITPWKAAFHGKYRLYARLHDTTPAILTDGIVAELVMEDGDGTFTGTLTSYDGEVSTAYAFTPGDDGSAIAGWFTVVVSGDDVTCYWRGAELVSQTVDAHTGTRMGFGLNCTQDNGVCLANIFRVQYSAGSIEGSRALLVGSAGGSLYREAFSGKLDEVTSDLTVRDDVPLSAAQAGQKLYIADYGDKRVSGIVDGVISADGLELTVAGVSDWTVYGIDAASDVVAISDATGDVVDGTYEIASVAETKLTLTSTAGGAGTCGYSIERGLKSYDPLGGTLSILTATAGIVPVGNPVCCRYRGRLVLGGADLAAHVWYMSRQNDPADWDYAETDAQRAVAGTSSDAGVPGEPIVAMIPHTDDYLIFGCENSMWRMRGDPAFGGSLSVLSGSVGIVGRDAWCVTPEGILLFLAVDGLYGVPAAGAAFPEALSVEVLPGDLRGSGLRDKIVTMQFDAIHGGVHIYVTQDDESAGTVHWWFDWTSKTFWPVTLQADHDPCAICTYQSASVSGSDVILGCRDGYLRYYHEDAENDDGSSVASYVLYGPIPLAPDGYEGTITEINAILADQSGDVTWSLVPARTFHGVRTGDVTGTGTWHEGINLTARPPARGQAFALKIEGDGVRKWAAETITAQRKRGGKIRLPS